MVNTLPLRDHIRMFCIGLLLAGTLSAQTFASKWDRVQALGPGIAEGSIAERLAVKDSILAILLRTEDHYPIIYVNSNAQGNNDGTSWENAYTALQPAINQAHSSEAWVWVAQGSYTGRWRQDDVGAYVTLAAIKVLSRVAVFGGFRGDETRIVQRDPETYPTIIYGALGPWGPRAVYMDHLTLLDGFEIKDSGFQDYTSLADHAAGGGIRCGNWLSVIRNNRLHGNYAKGGAGIAAWNRNNSFNVEGFVPIIERNVIYDNSGICGSGVQLRETAALFCNNVVADNWHNEKSKGIEIVITPSISARPVVVNSIIWGNAYGGFPDLYNHVDYVAQWGQESRAVSEYNCIETAGYASAGLITANPLFVNASARNYKLRDDSPCINAGHPDGPPDGDGSRADVGIFTMEVFNISGSVFYCDTDEAISDVDVRWREAGQKIGNTDDDGCFTWADVAKGTEATITCTLPDEDNSNPAIVTAYDAALTARHCLGLDTLTGYNLMAADVDESNHVDLKDASWIARTAVGMDNDSQAHGLAWRFYPSERVIPGVFSNLTDEDFHAYILGDVNGQWGNGGAGKAVAFATSPLSFTISGDTLIFELAGLENIDMISADVHFTYDPALLKALAVRTTAATAGFTVQTHEPEPGDFRIAMYGLNVVNTNEPILTIRIEDLTDAPVETTIDWTLLRINEVELTPWQQSVTTEVAENDRRPDFSLEENYPNPFNPATSVGFSLDRASQVSLLVFDALGRQVRVLSQGLRTAGRHEVLWDGCDDSGREMPSGLYFCRLQAGESVRTVKMMKIK